MFLSALPDSRSRFAPCNQHHGGTEKEGTLSIGSFQVQTDAVELLGCKNTSGQSFPLEVIGLDQIARHGVIGGVERKLLNGNVEQFLLFEESIQLTSSVSIMQT